MSTYDNNDQRKLSALIDNDLYHNVTKNLQYGQLSLLLRRIFICLSTIEKHALMEFLYGDGEITLGGKDLK